MVRRLPFGRYRVAHALASIGSRPFMARLPRELGGAAFYCDLRDTIAREVCFTGRYEPQETRICQSVLRHGDTFVDVGANWGYFTLAAASWVVPAGRVVSFEPDPRLFRILTANLRANGMSHVLPQALALGDHAGPVRLAGYDEAQENRGTSRIVRNGTDADFEVEMIPLDQALDAAAVGSVRLVKMDIEGGEYEALRGMRDGLSRGRYEYLLIECHPGALSAQRISVERALEPLVEARYRLWRVAQSAGVYRRAARTDMALADLLHPLDRVDSSGVWPHFLATAPRAAIWWHPAPKG